MIGAMSAAHVHVVGAVVAVAVGVGVGVVAVEGGDVADSLPEHPTNITMLSAKPTANCTVIFM